MSISMIYLLKASVCMGLFYMLYHFLLRKETFFIMNRVYLLFTVLLSMLLPLIRIPTFGEGNLLFQVELAELVIRPTMEGIDYVSGFSIILGIYVLGASIFALRFIGQLFHLYRLISSEKGLLHNDYTIIYSEKSQQTCSFLNYLIVPASSNLEEAVRFHEIAHIRQKHSYDIIGLGILQIFFWFNPFFYMIKKALRDVHEYLADEAVIRQFTLGDYARLMLREALEESPQLAHSFHTNIQKRINMMIQKKSARNAKGKYLLMIPMLAALCFVFSCTEEATTITTTDEISSKSESSNVFKEVEQMPAFPGGEMELLQFIYTNIKYPKAARDNGIEGLVVISFVIDKKGQATDFTIKKEIGGGCGKEALRVAKLMPKWTPGEHFGERVNVMYNLPVRFKLE